MKKNKMSWNGYELYNIEILYNDFNFFDIQANYVGKDGKEKLGKFYTKDLKIEVPIIGEIEDKKIIYYKWLKKATKNIPKSYPQENKKK